VWWRAAWTVIGLTFGLFFGLFLKSWEGENISLKVARIGLHAPIQTMMFCVGKNIIVFKMAINVDDFNCILPDCVFRIFKTQFLLNGRTYLIPRNDEGRWQYRWSHGDGTLDTSVPIRIAERKWSNINIPPTDEIYSVSSSDVFPNWPDLPAVYFLPWNDQFIILTNRNVYHFYSSDCRTRLSDREKPLIFHFLQLASDGFSLIAKGKIGLYKNGSTNNCSEEQQSRKNHQPSGETVNRQWLFEPPWFFLLKIFIFGVPGLACGIAGFIFVNGPHRRLNLGVALYFLGMGLFSGAAFLVGLNIL